MEASREKGIITAEELSVILTADSSSATTETQRQWEDIFTGKVSKKNVNQEIYMDAKYSSKLKGHLRYYQICKKKKTNPNRISITSRAALPEILKIVFRLR